MAFFLFTRSKYRFITEKENLRRVLGGVAALG